MGTLNIIFSGFAISWWWIIDADAWSGKFAEPACRIAWWYYLAPILTTLGLTLVNLVSARVIEKEEASFWGGQDGLGQQRGVLFTFMAVMFSGVGMAAWVMAKWYLGDEAVVTKYPGTALMGGTALMAFTGLLFKFSRSHDTDSLLF